MEQHLAADFTYEEGEALQELLRDEASVLTLADLVGTYEEVEGLLERLRKLVHAHTKPWSSQ